jgi:hypothetical protein
VRGILVRSEDVLGLMNAPVRRKVTFYIQFDVFIALKSLLPVSGLGLISTAHSVDSDHV